VETFVECVSCRLRLPLGRLLLLSHSDISCQPCATYPWQLSPHPKKLPSTHFPLHFAPKWYCCNRNWQTLCPPLLLSHLCSNCCHFLYRRGDWIKFDTSQPSVEFRLPFIFATLGTFSVTRSYFTLWEKKVTFFPTKIIRTGYLISINSHLCYPSSIIRYKDF